jgi:hypothetical protein
MAFTALLLEQLRWVSVAIGAAFVGYTLQPLPIVLENLFKTSYLFKLLVITVFILNVMGKLSLDRALTALLTSAIVLAIFEVVRRNDNALLNM